MASFEGSIPRIHARNQATGQVRNGRLRVLAALVLMLLAAAVVWYRPLWVMDRVTQVRMAAAGMHGRDIVLDGHRIHYLEGGQGDPILLVHGLGSRATDWAGLIPALTRSHHRVYAIDLLGYGDSDKPKDANFSIQQEAKLVEGFLQAKNLQHVELAGWSMGGWISMVVATDQPARISKLVLMDSAGLRFQPTFDPLLFTPSNLHELRELMTLLTPDTHAMPGFIAKALLDRSQEDSWVIRRSVTSMLTGQNLLDGRLSELQMPVLIVWGKQDMLTPLSMAYQLHAGVPTSMLQLYDGCGHLAPGLCAKQIAPHLLTFLDQPDAQQHATLEVPDERKKPLHAFLW